MKWSLVVDQGVQKGKIIPLPSILKGILDTL
jgi:hypothetical protein